jgi:hypothetical protein
MKYWLALGLLAIMALVVTSTPARAVDQEAIDRSIAKGVRALREMQTPEGTWPHEFIGATALAGLTLLECGANKEDKDVLRAADAVRKASIHLTHTYSISLSLLFLDRLGDPEDRPFIESLIERLLGGQDPASGGWSYNCPVPSEADKQKLQEKLNNRKRPASSQDGEKAGEKRNDDGGQVDPRRRSLPPGAGASGFPQPQIPPVPAADFGLVGGPGDNSNTQFAALGLWVARRYGAKIDQAVTRLAQRFRNTQQEDGGWTYMGAGRPLGMPAFAPLPPGMGSTPAMTCAGLIALAIADGATLEYARKLKPDGPLPDISKDKHLQKGLEALGAVIDNPKGQGPGDGRPGGAFGPRDNPFGRNNRVGGRTYYFLWSLERMAVALDLKTIGKKDWYGWGAEILLENQNGDGSWSGDYAGGGVDTCFALLFLRRANLVSDLTVSLKGKITDPAERVLSGGVRKAPGQNKMLSGIESKDSRPVEKPLLKAIAPESRQLAESLLKATGTQRDELIESMENEKGVKYTEALAAAIPKLDGDSHRKAREALANRLTRMKDETLQEYFQDDDPEIRRAAAIAAGQKDSKTLVPYLISLLRDPENSVVRAAHASLKSLTEKDFGPAATATREERDQAVQKWIAWWSKQRKKD